MTLYSIIYDFYATYIFTSGDAPASSFTIGGASLTMAEWLNHTATIATLAWLVIVCFLFIRWLVKLIGGGIASIGR